MEFHPLYSNLKLICTAGVVMAAGFAVARFAVLNFEIGWPLIASVAL
jgi:hypothetical protein